MRVACASGAFDAAIQRGDLTQLEWIESCARDFACDGIVLDVRHFPRTDADYLAQIKKFATDLGLGIAALADDAFFSAEPTLAAEVIGMAVSLGAPLISGRLAPETACSWSEQLTRLDHATGLAKGANVTLALRNAPQSFAASVYDCKRATKQTDSAWLAFGLEPATFDAASDPATLLPRSVLLWQALGDTRAGGIARLLAEFGAFLGFVALDEPGGTASAAEMRAAVAAYRNALASSVLNRP